MPDLLDYVEKSVVIGLHMQRGKIILQTPVVIEIFCSVRYSMHRFHSPLPLC